MHYIKYIVKYTCKNINHWRTMDKKEIDFILSKKNEITPIEVKLNSNQLKHTPL